MPSRVLETVLTGRNLLSPVLTGAARDVEAYDAKVSAASARAGESTAASAKVQETSAAKVIAANTRTATSSEAMSAKIAASQAKASESSRAFADVSQSSAARSAAAWSSLATKGLPLAAAAVAVVTGKMAADFQTNIVKLETTAGESQKNLGVVSKGLLDMAGQVGVSATTLAKGAYTVESAGFHGRDALLVMKAAAQGAAQEQADLTKVTDAVTTALHDYNLPASDAARVTSQMVTAVSHGKTTFDELTGSLHSVTPLAAALHVPLADILGDLSAMTASGESADQATQNMADALRHLQNPTSIMTGELAQLGITSSDLAGDLSSKGLSGTIQEIEQAILQHLDPATQRVLLPAFNQSKLAAQDLNTMLGHMPPTLAKLSQGLLDGSVSFKDYRTKVRDLGGQAEVLGTNFLGLFQSSQGFNQQLKNGGPAAQVFSAALQKAMGDSSGLTVALQLTGDHAVVVNGSIKDIAKSAGDAQGNIRGWDEVQGTFNQKLHETGAEAGALAIQVGQHVLPVLSSTVGWIGSTGIPGIEHLGSAVGGAVHWFLQLPGPVRDAALAFAAVKTAMSLNFLGVASGIGLIKTQVTGLSAAFAEEVSMQRWAATVQGITSGAGAAEAGVSKIAVAGGLASRALGGIKSAGAGLLSFFGGPWAVGLLLATGGILALIADTERYDEKVKQATQDVQKWNEAVALGVGGQTSVQAAQHLQDMRDKLAAVTEQINEYNAAAAQGNARGGIGILVSQQKELRGELDKGTAAWKAQLAAMTPVQEAQYRVDQATQDLNMALKNNPPNSQAVTNASIRLHDAQKSLAEETDHANAAAKTQIQRLQDQANAALGLLGAQRASQLSQMQMNDAIDQYNSDAKDGQHTTRQLKEEQIGLADSAQQTAQAAADAAAQQAKQNGATDTGSASQAAFVKSLQETAAHLTGDAKQAVLDMITTMGAQTDQAHITAGAINQIGVTVLDLPDQKLVTIDVPTDKQMQDLHNLGYVTATLPDGKIVVTADTNPAQQEIQQLLNYARSQSIIYRATLPSLVDNSVASGSGRAGLATGGWVRGPGTETSDSVPLMGSNGEFMVKAARARENAGLLEDINAGRVKGYADGGWVGLSPDGTWPVGSPAIPVHVQDAGYEASIHNYLSQLTSFSGTGAGSPFMRILGQSIAAGMGYGGQFGAIDYIFSRESGWNPLAQNPTSTAFGIPQFLDSTWGPYGGKTTDAAQQIRDGIEYMVNRYGSPNAAAAFWAAHHWYGNGGVVNGAQLVGVGESGPEAIVPLSDPARRDAVLAQAGLAAPAMPGYGTPFSGAVFGPGGPVNVSAQVRVFLGDREITDIVRVEATAVVDAELGALADSLHYSGN